MFDLLAAGFLLFTVVMVLGTFFLGFLNWREERNPPSATAKLAKRTDHP